MSKRLGDVTTGDALGCVLWTVFVLVAVLLAISFVSEW